MGGRSLQRETSRDQGRGRSWALAGGSLGTQRAEKGRQAGAGPTLTPCLCPRGQPGEPYVTIKAYTAEMEDEVSLQEGEAIEVIHKLLDGWWVIR